MPNLSLRAFARRLGCDEKAVRKAIASGRLTAAVVGKDGKGRPVIVDEGKARAEWTRNATKARAATPNEATRQLTLEKTLALRLANGLKAKTLVVAADVEQRWTRIGAEVRTALLGVPVRLRMRRPGLTRDDLAAVDELIRHALEALADAHDDVPPEPGRAMAGETQRSNGT